MPARNDTDHILAELLAGGKTPREAATLLGRSLPSVKKKLRDPLFCELVEHARMELAQRVRSSVCQSALRAVTVLENLLTDPEPAMRFRAAQTLLNTFARLSPVVLAANSAPDSESGQVIELVQRVITRTETVPMPVIEQQPSPPSE